MPMPSTIRLDHMKYSQLLLTEEQLLETSKFKSYRTTPFIVTFCEGALTHIDIQMFIEMGLHIVRFRFNLVTRKDKLMVLNMLDTAVRWICEKYDVEAWPIALCLDLPSVMVRTGTIDESIGDHVLIKTDSTVTLTNHADHWYRCNANTIYMNDRYVMDELRPGIEITLRYGNIVLMVTKRIDEKSVLCNVERCGELACNDFLCARGIKFKKPSITEKDLDIISFAKEFKADMITIHSVRNPETVRQVRGYFKSGHVPLIMSSICEEEGLENLDSIIAVSDAIILCREFLAHQIPDKYKMITIQLHINGKCKQAGKPLFLSGNIMGNTLMTGEISSSDVSDVTNAIMQGAGFILREYKQPSYVLKALDTVNSICKAVESLGAEDDLLRLFMELRQPVSAAEGCILSCALLAKQLDSPVVVVPTVTGRTAVQLSHMAPDAIILTVTTSPVVARKLQMYKGIFPIIYSKKRKDSWLKEILARIHFAVEFGIKKQVVKYGNAYVILRKSDPTSSYCDNVSTGVVLANEFENRKHICDFEVDVHKQITYEMHL